MFGVSVVAGPLLGGFFVDNLSWRWIFYVNLPTGALAFVVIGAVFHARANRVGALFHWAISFFGRSRPERTITAQQIFAREALAAAEEARVLD